MSFYKGALPVDEIRHILDLRLAPLAEETIPLTEALGRVAACPVVASNDLPDFDKSAMDGYAVHAEDLSGGVLEPAGECLIGQTMDVKLTPGMTIYVSTGAPVPLDAAAVVPVEESRVFDGAVVVGESTEGKHIIRRGERLKVGQIVVDAGAKIDLAKITLLASQRVEQVSVFKLPTVSFFATGDELSESPHRFEVIDAITPAVQAWCLALGLELASCGHLPDNATEIEKALREATADLVITSGGASVGRKDFTRQAVASLAEIIVPGICIKPGSPAFIAIRDRQTYLGLPGNPNAAAHQLELLGGMILKGLTGSEDFSPREARGF